MTINVPMEVSRVEAVGSMVQVWGHVGDYEVCVYITVLEARTMGLTVLPRERRARRLNQMTIVESLYKENGGQQ